jgi:diamine N-acetyltransferase
MNVSLREIDKNNFRECVNLKVAGSQEKFVAPNVMSIAQLKIYPAANAFAVYAGEEMVGFVMYGCDEDDGHFYLGRLMIDEKHQGKGFGRAATLEVIERMKQAENCQELFLSFVPENVGAEKLYSSIGFERTGKTSESGEIIMRFDLKKSDGNGQAAADN